ncbi:efflux RND transporter periplasmic adaptor subunit [Brasilonema octagenarum]|uniref:Efflux transporter periplasmic adaptor subunit n=1 Tax=Brasilonema octagenarum UFV-OR1 TaxID=417115 RepID=A0ABX1M6R0_9CYAN|nr:efflux RND transporter periplasmic adaptor subunit [Brasilonema octagenarum]NMF62654.1 efflux transporter periplasmic adaptor subunit [Brasilonema octagenarum UFV-OR1]
MKSPEPQTHFEDNRQETELEEPPRRQRRWLWLLLALLLAGGGFALWRWLAPQNKAPATANAQPPAARVKISTVQAGMIEDSERYLATVESRRSVTLQPRIEGQVSQVFVKYGDSVIAGTPIIQVDARQQQAAVGSVNAAAEVSQSQVENARATLRSLEAERLSKLADLKLNQQDYERYTSLASQGAVSRQISDQYANKLATSRAAVGQIEAQMRAQQATISQAEKSLKEAQANIRQQQVQLQYYKITAPFAGTVGNIPVKVGDFVNTSTQLVTITQNQSLELNISVPVERGTQLRKGTPVEVMDAQGKSIGMSRVFFVAPKATDNSQSLLVKVLYDNSQNQLRTDQIAYARVIWSQRPGVLIPATAVTNLAGETFVYVTVSAPSKPPQGEKPKGNQQGEKPQGNQQAAFQLLARQKRVKLGNITGNNYQVLQGLEPGDRIIVSGLLNLRDGVPVIPES